MNRRSFFLGASAGMALISNQALAQRRGQRSSTLTSELTGGEVDLAETELEMVNQHIDEADGSEHFHFAVEGGQFDLIFWPHSSGEATDFVANAVGMFTAVMPDTEELGADTYEDGGWVAFDAGVLGYYEYQLDAYGDHDLIVTLAAPTDTFQQVYEQAQAILIDGIPPFLFSEESDIVALAAERVASTPSTSSRTSRGSTTQTTNSRSSRSSSNQTTTGDPVDAVIEHRSTFLTSYDAFFEHLELAADETASDREVEDAFAALVNIAYEWQVYPDQAAEIAFTPDLADLKSVYLEWAGAVGEMGFAFEDFYMGTATVDDYLAVHDQWAVIDDELVALLGGLGHRSNRRATRRIQVARSLASIRTAA